ncbi:MAG TPA: hypothetical protein PKM65_20435 [Spirochaetota bacterium]|nr:hypothetical protein [Spirochaetota bacterium]
MNNAEVVSVYTRYNAIEDGFLVDLTAVSRPCGIIVPVAVTDHVWYEIGDPDNSRSAIMMIDSLRKEIKLATEGKVRPDGNILPFQYDGLELWSVLSDEITDASGEKIETCMTIMFPEDY